MRSHEIIRKYYVLKVQKAVESCQSETDAETKSDDGNEETEDLGPEDINQTATFIKGGAVTVNAKMQNEVLPTDYRVNFSCSSTGW